MQKEELKFVESTVFEGMTSIRSILRGIDLGVNNRKINTILFDKDKRDVHSGGSGCGCSASVLASFILPMIERGEFKRVLLMSTGALMSPSSVCQGEHIMGIAPALKIEHNPL